MRKIILLSGGMDSMLSMRLFCPEHEPVFIRTGSRYEQFDLVCARMQTARLTVHDFPTLAEEPNGVVPHRNAVILSFVANWLGEGEIVVSAPRGELIWDQQPGFHRLVEQVLPGIRIVNPLRHLTKTQAVAQLVQQYTRPRAQVLLQHTRSCYSGTAHRCGRCPACVKRWVAMRNNGFTEHYEADVRLSARELTQRGTMGDLWRYGLRPAVEAWKALRNAP